MADNTEVFFESVRNKNALLADATDFTLEQLAIAAVSQAKPLAPKDNGQLRNSIQWKIGKGLKGGENDPFEGKDASPSSLSVGLKRSEAAIGATAEHAVYQEFGTRYQQPQQFLRPSLAFIAGKAPEIIKKEMNDEVKEWHKNMKKEKL